MAISTHLQGIDKLIAELQNEPDWLVCLGEYLRRMQSGFYSQDLIDIVYQKWDADYLTNLGEIYVFANIHTWITTGKIAVATLNMGTVPRYDRCVNGNDEILADYISRLSFLSNGNGRTPSPCTWRGEFWGGTQDEDGYVQWEGNAVFEIFGNSSEPERRLIPSDKVPLEVGVTYASKTYLQLKTRGGIARWPYGQKHITILKVLEPQTFRNCLLR